MSTEEFVFRTHIRTIALAIHAGRDGYGHDDKPQ